MAKAYSEILNHYALALARLKLQFQDSTEFKALLAAIASEVQAFESALSQVAKYTRDHNAAATDGKLDALSQIGQLVGARPQGTLTASEFAAMISAQIKVNVSDGHLDELIEIADLFLAALLGPILYANDVEGPQLGPFHGGAHAVNLTPTLNIGDNVSPEVLRNAADLLRQATPAGNRTILNAAVAPANTVGNPLFILDVTNTDGPEMMLVSIDNPASVR